MRHPAGLVEVFTYNRNNLRDSCPNEFMVSFRAVLAKIRASVRGMQCCCLGRLQNQVTLHVAMLCQYLPIPYLVHTNPGKVSHSCHTRL
jgi:hypothetical protein